jgi:hypothetical protein
MLKIQELNEDQSPRLDDNGDPIYQFVSDDTYYKLINTPIGQKRWKLIKEQKLKIEVQRVPESEPEPGTILESLDSHVKSKPVRKAHK